MADGRRDRVRCAGGAAAPGVARGPAHPGAGARAPAEGAGAGGDGGAPGAEKKSPGDLGGRGRAHGPEERTVIQTLIADAVAGGARQHEACQLLGVSARTLERWRAGAPDDARQGPRHGLRQAPPNQLTCAERRAVLATVNAAEYRDLSPNQIVPRLADAGQYLASESTIYRILRAEEQLTHRGRAKAPLRRPPRAHHATGPDQVWSWDITYLKTPVRRQVLSRTTQGPNGKIATAGSPFAA